MRVVKLILSAILVLLLIFLAVLNGEMVTLTLLPPLLAGIFPFASQVTLPLFVVVLSAVFLGLLLGFVWEYLREFRHRREASAAKSANRKLERELEALRQEKNGKGDDVLALLD